MNSVIALYGLLDDEEVPIDAVALELSALDHDDAGIMPYLEQVNAMAARVLALSEQDQTPAQQAAVLAAVLAGENGFTGDREAYDAPINADLIRVFDRRRGLPISLAIIYVAVARRLGWAAHVLNIPGHVVVGIGADKPALIDAFNDGVILDGDDLAGPAPGQRGTLTAPALRMSNRDVLVRLLQNQAGRAEQGRDYERALTIYERMTIVAPDHSQGWGALARLQMMFGATAPARASLIALLELTREASGRAQITQALTRLAAA